MVKGWEKLSVYIRVCERMEVAQRHELHEGRS
jgi:hypothetical protein